jgi:GWxTD domain-containing protein
MTEILYHRHTILRATVLVALLAVLYGIGVAGISAHPSNARCGLFEFPVIALGGGRGQDTLRTTHTEEFSPALDTLIQLGRSAVVQQDWEKVLSLALSGLRCDSTSLQCHYLAAIAEREFGSGFAQQNIHRKMAQVHFEWILRRDSTFEDALIQYAVLERDQGNRGHALELAQLQLAITPDNEAAKIGLFRLLRYFLIAQSPEEFLSWSKGYSGASFRFFEGEAMRRAGRVGSADSVLTSLLGVIDGVPQEAVRIARARLCFMRGNHTIAESEYMMAVQGLSSDAGAEVLFDDIKYIISDAELDWYRGLHSLTLKQEFFRSFWQFRNPLPASKLNPRLLEHIRRYLIAEERYEYAGPRAWFSDPDKVHDLVFPRAFALNEEFNDMGLVYLRQGAPDDIARHSYSPFDDDDVKERIAKLLDYFPGRVKPLDFRERELFAAEVRDRYRGSEKEDYESWLYDPTGDSPQMIFHFQKHHSVGNSWRLTACPDFDPMILKLSGWDRRFEDIYNVRQPAMRVMFENDVKTESRTLVKHALSTDRQTWDKQVSIIHFPHAIDMFRGGDGGSLLDISYAMPITTLSHLLPDTMHALPVEIGFSMVNTRNQQSVSELDTVVVEIGKGRTGALVDLIRYTVPPASYAVSMHLRSLTGNILGGWKQELDVEDFSKPGLTMSSVQLLRRSPQQGALEIDGVKVVQSPFATQLLNEPFYVYFQIYDLIPDGDGTISYATECRLIRAGDHGWDEGIPIHTKEKVGKERNVSEFYTIDLEKTKPGRYTLVVGVTDRMRRESISATRLLEVVKS